MRTFTLLMLCHFLGKSSLSTTVLFKISADFALTAAFISSLDTCSYSSYANGCHILNKPVLRHIEHLIGSFYDIYRQFAVIFHNPHRLHIETVLRLLLGCTDCHGCYRKEHDHYQIKVISRLFFHKHRP